MRFTRTNFDCIFKHKCSKKGYRHIVCANCPFEITTYKVRRIFSNTTEMRLFSKGENRNLF